MLISNLKIYKKDLQKLGPIKFVKKYAAETIIIGAIVASVVGGASAITVNALNKTNEKENQEITTNYLHQKYQDQMDPQFYVNFIDIEREMPNVKKYIEVSEKLHNLNLDIYADIESFDYIVPFIEGKDLDNLIQDFENLKAQEKFNNIGDDVIELNKKVYELKSLEKQYNLKVSNSYNTIINYGKDTSKLYLSDLYGSKASDYEISINDQFHEGSILIEAHGIAIKDDNIYKRIEILRDLYRARDTYKSDKKEDEYNSSRNKIILDSIEKFEQNDQIIIKQIENEKNNEVKSQKL